MLLRKILRSNKLGSQSLYRSTGSIWYICHPLLSRPGFAISLDRSFIRLGTRHVPRPRLLETRDSLGLGHVISLGLSRSRSVSGLGQSRSRSRSWVSLGPGLGLGSRSVSQSRSRAVGLGLGHRSVSVPVSVGHYCMSRSRSVSVSTSLGLKLNRSSYKKYFINITSTLALTIGNLHITIYRLLGLFHHDNADIRISSNINSDYNDTLIM